MLRESIVSLNGCDRNQHNLYSLAPNGSENSMRRVRPSEGALLAYVGRELAGVTPDEKEILPIGLFRCSDCFGSVGVKSVIRNIEYYRRAALCENATSGQTTSFETGQSYPNTVSDIE